MNHALIENGIVVNIIVGHIEGSVPTQGRPVAIGDEYRDGRFYRDGEPVLTEAEKRDAEIAELTQVVDSQTAVLLDVAYKQILMEWGLL